MIETGRVKPRASDHNAVKAGGRFAQRSYPARLLGLGLGFIGVAAAMAAEARSWPVWVLLITYSFLWPHIAYIYASRVSDSYGTGCRQLLFDAFCGGLWVAAISFNLLPSVLVLTMLGMNNVASGGIALWLKGLCFQLLGVLCGVAIFGWDPHWHSTLWQIVACVPFLAIHPLVVGMMTFGFAQRLHDQKTRLKVLSRTDSLTGLYNRGYWDLRAEEEFTRGQRCGSSSVMLMLDIDHFKTINDTHGHVVGDHVLRDFGELLQDQLRNVDVIGRFGGEEFAAVLVDMNLSQAETVSARLLKAVEEHRFGGDHVLRCTASIGLASVSSRLGSYREWINAADQALYQAKSAGRNCFRGSS